ncbi:DUF945 family protein [Orrella marina]|uniref:Uncharacterized protein n=1 Tax=Orrella marina TaxID=2163011 RepID=A0A2R4XHB2_9BURK|nr:DUF945 family protein [Orrella marina]AWB33195.1 hypothetical protein DBV39_05140 [Orrella marina]
MTDSNSSIDTKTSSANQGDTSRVVPPRRIRRRNSPWRSVLITIGVLAVGYSAASYYAGMRSESELRAYVELPPSPGSVKPRLDRHERGIWQSSGTLTLASVVPATQATASENTQTARAEGADAIVIHYVINHALMPDRLARVSWRAQPSESLGMEMQDSFNPTPVLSGIGTLDWEGRFDSSLAMPAFRIVSGNADQAAQSSPQSSSRNVSNEVAFSAMQGELRTYGRELTLNMHWPEIDLLEVDRASSGSSSDSTPGATSRSATASTLAARGVRLDIAMSDRIEGEGQNRLHVAALKSDDLQIADLSVTGRSHAGSTMSLAINTQIGRMQSGMYALDGVVLDGVIKGLNPEAVRRLQQIWNETAGLQQVTEEQADQWRHAMRELILSGLVIDIPELAAGTSFGKVRGQSVFTLAPVPASQRGNPAEPIDFEGYVSSKGRLILQGQGISPTLTALGLLTGVLVRTPDGVMASYELDGDRLALNGKSLPALPALVVINRILNPLVVQSDGSILDRLLEDYIDGYKPQNPELEVLPVPNTPDLQDRQT